MLIGGSLLVVIALRLLARLDDPPWPVNDTGFRNILTLIFSFIAVFTAWVWLCYFSGFSAARAAACVSRHAGPPDWDSRRYFA